MLHLNIVPIIIPVFYPLGDSSPSAISNGEAASSQPEGENSTLKQREPPDGSEGAGDSAAAAGPSLEEERPQRRGGSI